MLLVLSSSEAATNGIWTVGLVLGHLQAPCVWRNMGVRWLWILVAMSPRRQIPSTASAEEYEHDMLTHIPFRSWHVGQDARTLSCRG